jgi:hypothetical protein
MCLKSAWRLPYLLFGILEGLGRYIFGNQDFMWVVYVRQGPWDDVSNAEQQRGDLHVEG